jgi:hypothetical protein
VGDSVDSTGSKKKMATFDKLWFSLHAAPKITSAAVLLHVFRLIVT